jgi:hypothetical protein
MSESIEQRIKRWKAVAKTGPCWALVLAKEVCDLADKWERFKPDTVDKDHPNGQSPTSFLRDVFGDGKGLAWWRRRALAVEIMGEWVRRSVDHDVAVWFVHAVPEDKRREAAAALMKGCRDNGDNPLTGAQARLVLKKIIGKNHSSPRQCMRCAKLEELLRVHGIDPDAVAAE